MKANPLWLPEGSIRGILALSLVGGAIYAALAEIAADVLFGLAGSVSIYYFKHREDVTARNGQPVQPSDPDQ